MADCIITSTSGIANNVSVTTASSTAQALGTGDACMDVVFQAVDVGVYLRFGASGVADCSAANSLCYIPAGQVATITVRPKQTHFKALGGASGTLKWWLG